MELAKTSDFQLLNNYLIIKQKEINYENEPNKEEKMKKIQTILTLLKSEDQTRDSIQEELNKPEYAGLVKKINVASPQDLAKESIETTISILKNTNKYSTEAMEKIIHAYCQDTSLDEETLLAFLPQTATFYPNLSMEDALKNIKSLLQKNRPNTTDAYNFKAMSKEYKKNIKTIGIRKLQEAFDDPIEDIDITSDVNEESMPFYQTTIHFETGSDKVITEPKSKTTYFHTLCDSYLAADKYANSSPNLIKQETIQTQIDSYHDSYIQLKEMAKCKFNMIPNDGTFRIIYSNFSEIVPDKNKPEEITSLEDDFPFPGE